MMHQFWGLVPWVILGWLLVASLASGYRQRRTEARWRSMWEQDRYDRALRRTVGDRRRTYKR